MGHNGQQRSIIYNGHHGAATQSCDQVIRERPGKPGHRRIGRCSCRSAERSQRNLHARLSSFISMRNRPSPPESDKSVPPACTALRGWSNLITSACPRITEQGLPGDACVQRARLPSSRPMTCVATDFVKPSSALVRTNRPVNVRLRRRQVEGRNGS